MNQPPNGQGYPGGGQQPGQPWQSPGQHQQAGYNQPPQGFDQTGGPGYLPPGAPGQSPKKKDNKPVIIAGAGIFLFAALGIGLIAFLATKKDSTVTDAAGVVSSVSTSSTLADNGAVVTEIPGKETTRSTVKRPTVQPGAKPTPVPTTTKSATTKAATATTADVCGAGVGSAATGIVAGDPFVIAKVDAQGAERGFDMILDAGDTVQVNAYMVDFDPAMEVVDSNGTSVGINDDGPFGLDSQVTFTVATGGFHTVYVFSIDPEACGLFEIDALVVSTGGGGGGTALSPPSTNSFFVSLSASPVRIEVEALVGDVVEIHVVDAGDGADPLISMVSPTGAPNGSDDNGGSAIGGPLDSLVKFTATEAGTYEGFIESVNGVPGNAQVIILIN